MMRNVLREPLLHFLLLGAALFGVGLLRGDAGGPGANRIALTPGVVERLMEGFRRTWQRPPTESEFRGLVEVKGRTNPFVDHRTPPKKDTGTETDQFESMKCVRKVEWDLGPTHHGRCLFT